MVGEEQRTREILREVGEEQDEGSFTSNSKTPTHSDQGRVQWLGMIGLRRKKKDED